METINRCLLTFLVNSLWQIPLVAAVAALACRFMRKSPASHRHGVWVAAMVSALLLPLASMIATGALWQAPPPSVALRITPPLAMPFGSPASPRAEQQPATTGAAAPVRPATTPRARTVPFAAAAILLGGYALFLLFRLGQLALACLRTIQIRRAGTPAEPSALVQSVWERSETALRVSGVELFASPALAGPVTAGAWRKTIILPEPLLAGQSEDVLTTAIGHEMAHIARHDFALNLLYELMYLPLAFHPAAALIRRGIERTRELACDELVTRSLIDPRVYARSIMSIAAGITALPGPALRPSYMLGVFDGDILEERIKLLLARPAAGVARNLAGARLLLATALTALAACVVIGSGLAVSARAQSGSRTEMKLASDAYSAADFPAAVQHFINAVQAEPSDLNAKLFLANALIREHDVTEAGQTGGTPILAKARQQYADVLASDPNNTVAMEGMLAIALGTRQLAEAHDWALKITQINPQAKTAFYSAGFIDWSMAYPPIQAGRKASGLDPRDQTFIPDAAVRKSLRDQYQPQIEDGLRMLQSAVSLDPNYSDAYAYLNLLDRLAASLADNQAEADNLTAKADALVRRAIDAQRRQPKSHQQGSGKLDVNAPPVGALTDAAPPPPPPPPPPPGYQGGNGDKYATNQVPSAIPIDAAVQAGKLLSQTDPVYPPLAWEARVSGTVKLAVIVGPDGHLQDVSVLSGHPLLLSAALQAVKQWVYQPTVLNGNPVAVSTTVQVSFALPR